jgi:hypothetical protein
MESPDRVPLSEIAREARLRRDEREAQVRRDASTRESPKLPQNGTTPEQPTFFRRPILVWGSVIIAIVIAGYACGVFQESEEDRAMREFLEMREKMKDGGAERMSRETDRVIEQARKTIEAARKPIEPVRPR